MSKPKAADLDSTATAALVAAMPPVDVDAELVAAKDVLAVKSQARRDCEAEVAASDIRVQVARAEGEAFIKQQVPPGGKRDPSVLRSHALTCAVEEQENALLRTGLAADVAAEAAAALEVLKATRHVALRDAERLKRPVTAARHDVADAGDTLVSAVKKAIAATEEQMSAAAVAEGLRLELLGIPDTRPYQFPHALEVRRFLSCLPTEWLREAGNGGFPVGDVDLRKPN